MGMAIMFSKSNFMIFVLATFIIFSHHSRIKADEERSEQQAHNIHKNAFSVDILPVGARGLVLKTEYERIILSNVSLVTQLRGGWISSDKLPFIYSSGYAHFDPYNHVNNILSLFGASESVSETEILAGVGFKLYPQIKPFNNGFYIKPTFSMGYGKVWLTTTEPENSIFFVTGNLFAGYKFWESTTDQLAFSKGVGSLIFIPEITVGYNVVFADRLMISLEGGAKYRLYSNIRIAKYLPALTGFEPSLSFMLGTLW